MRDGAGLRIRHDAAALAVLAVLYLAAALVRNSYYQLILTLVPIWAVMGLSWNLISGYSGLVSFGHAAFFGAGAYTVTSALVYWGLTPWLGIPLGMAVGALAAVLIGMPTFRLRGHYFALSMLAYPLAMLYVLEYLGFQEVPLPMHRAAAALPAPANRPVIEVPEVYRQRVEPDRSAKARRAGATLESEAAVERALDWLARHQDADGRWNGALHGLQQCACGLCYGCRTDLPDRPRGYDNRELRQLVQEGHRCRPENSLCGNLQPFRAARSKKGYDNYGQLRGTAWSSCAEQPRRRSTQ